MPATHIVFEGNYAYAVDGSQVNVLTLHPKTGKLIRESSLRWPNDYSAHEVASNLRSWYGPGARMRAVSLGAWEAAMLLEEVSCLLQR
jgi:hypothetical protein